MERLFQNGEKLHSCHVLWKAFREMMEIIYFSSHCRVTFPLVPRIADLSWIVRLQNVGRQNNDSDCGAFVLQVEPPPLCRGLGRVASTSGHQSIPRRLSIQLGVWGWHGSGFSLPSHLTRTENNPPIWAGCLKIVSCEHACDQFECSHALSWPKDMY